MKSIFVIILIAVLSINGYGQDCIQNKPNSLFSVNQFLNYTKTVAEGEVKLLAWDFCLSGTGRSGDGVATFYNYRIDHTYIINNGRYSYSFDQFGIADAYSNFNYLTSSNKNYIAYRNKLLQYKVDDFLNDPNAAIIEFLGQKYLLYFRRQVHQGTPNYIIEVHER